jgi:LysM repeat protein
MRIKNQNKAITLINDGEVNILKDAGLSDITFTAMIPHVKYPFSFYPGGFKEASFYLEKLEQLKLGKEPFQFICSRTSPSGGLLFDTNIKVSLEDYKIDEDASNGQALNVTITLKQYKDYGTKRVNIVQKVNKAVASASVTKARPTETAPKQKTYTVKSGDTLWNIAKKNLGNGSRYTEIFNLNKSKIQNPNLIMVGQVLTLPS